MLLPGPEAQQLAVDIGWLLHGTPGGLVAGILFILPVAAGILSGAITLSLRRFCYHRIMALPFNGPLIQALRRDKRHMKDIEILEMSRKEIE
jgi:chromate transport protein ChrA